MCVHEWLGLYKYVMNVYVGEMGYVYIYLYLYECLYMSIINVRYVNLCIICIRVFVHR